MTAVRGSNPRDMATQLLAQHDHEWVAEFADELDRRLSGRQVWRIMRVWGLSRTAAGELFGVSRQAVSKWLAEGVPAERAEQTADIAAITDLLSHYVKRDRIPAVVRRRAPGLEGMSLVELIAAAAAAMRCGTPGECSCSRISTHDRRATRRRARVVPDLRGRRDRSVGCLLRQGHTEAAGTRPNPGERCI